MRHLFKQLHTEWMSKFLAIYRWHHKRCLLKHSQNKYHAQINFSCPTYIRKQSFQPCFTSQNSSFKQIYDRAAQQLFFCLLNRVEFGYCWARMEQIFGYNSLSHHILTSLVRACSKQKTPCTNQKMRSGISSWRTWITNHHLINQNLIVPPIIINQNVNKSVLTWHFLEPIWNTAKIQE